MQNQKSQNLPKFIMTLSIIILIGTLFSTMFYLLNQLKKDNISTESNQIKSIELSEDKKSVLNSETKEIIFTIEEVNKYLHDMEYEYSPDIFLNNTNQTTNAKYGGDCFSDASLKIAVYDRIVFATGCLSGKIEQSWVGIYNFPYKLKTDLSQPPEIYFLAGDNGSRNFVWSEDGFYIDYEIYLDSEYPIKTKKINIYREIIYEKVSEIKDETAKDEIFNWKTYRNEEYGLEFQYPSDYWNLTEEKIDLSVLNDDNINKATGTEFVILVEKNGGGFVIKIMNKTIEQAIKRNSSHFGSKTGKVVNIGGIEGEELYGAFYGMKYVNYNEKTYFFELINTLKEDDFKRYDATVKSFRFID